MDNERSEKLLKKYLKGECTPEEGAIVESWYYEISGQQTDNLPEPDYHNIKMDVLNAVLKNNDKIKVKTMWPLIAVAASVLLFLGLGLYFYIDKSPSPQLITENQTRLIHSGTNQAVLTLANGRQILLNTAKNGALITQGNTTISKTADGKVVYNLSASTHVTQVSYNTISTPRGGQYQVILPDSSHVWLNAASSIRFPTAFIGSTREVTITGEAYFEVAHNAGKPFKVKSITQTIEVLGTHFNVNAYADERDINTTLLQGSVRLNGTTMLKPGEQALNNGTLIKVGPGNTENAIAWKEGKFKFTNQNITDLMRQLARWYDVDVDYEGSMTNKSFSGSVSRFDQIAKILNVLASTNTVHFKVEGRRITVMP